jgi:comEA protein
VGKQRTYTPVNLFTREEKTVVIFILACLFIGTGVHFYKKQYPAAHETIAPLPQEAAQPEKVNINEATVRELITIRHIGPSLAGRIIDERATSGPFRKCEDITRVKGIGEKTYEKIKDAITVE